MDEYVSNVHMFIYRANTPNHKMNNKYNNQSIQFNEMHPKVTKPKQKLYNSFLLQKYAIPVKLLSYETHPFQDTTAQQHAIEKLLTVSGRFVISGTERFTLTMFSLYLASK